MTEKIKFEERMHGDLKEHKHAGYDYWHPAVQVHAESTRDELPAGHVLSKKPLAEKLILDLVEVTPIQRMGIGKDLEIGAVESLMEGLEHHRHAASCLISDSCTLSECTTGGLFYAEWERTTRLSTKIQIHRHLIAIREGEVYVGYFPYDGRKPRLYGVHHKKQDVIKFLHKTHKYNLQLPELTLLTELNISNIGFGWDGDQKNRVNIFHKQGTFFTRSLYGEFTPLSECKFMPDPDSGNTPETVKGHWDGSVDATGYNMGDPKHPWYMFQGAIGYVQLFEGKMFCYPDGSIRFLTKEQEKAIFRGYTDLQIVQGDLVAYELEGHTVPEPQPIGVPEYNIDRHCVKVGWVEHPPEEQMDENDVWHDVKPNLLKYDNLGGLYIHEDCTLTITHPEHGETKYEALKGEMLTLLPGMSRPFQKDEGRD